MESPKKIDTTSAENALSALQKSSAIAFTELKKNDGSFSYLSLEWALRDTIRYFKEFKKLMIKAANIGSRRAQRNFEKELPQLFEISVAFEENPECFHAVFDTPPILKSRLSYSDFSEQFTSIIRDKVFDARPQNFTKYESARIIYINHFNANDPPAKQPYFDNDNLEVKAIWDAIIPCICIDDAARFCDNHYLCQANTSVFAEIFVVPKSEFRAWIQAHQNIDFCKEIT